MNVFYIQWKNDLWTPFKICVKVLQPMGKRHVYGICNSYMVFTVFDMVCHESESHG